MHNRIHDLVIDLAVQCPGPWGTAHRVCAEFLGLSGNRYGPGRGWGWKYRGKCALRQQP